MNFHVGASTHQHRMKIHSIHIQPFHLIQEFVLCLARTHSTGKQQILYIPKQIPWQTYWKYMWQKEEKKIKFNVLEKYMAK